jgi:hypothetical protein
MVDDTGGAIRLIAFQVDGRDRCLYTLDKGDELLFELSDIDQRPGYIGLVEGQRPLQILEGAD